MDTLQLLEASRVPYHTQRIITPTVIQKKAKRQKLTNILQIWYEISFIVLNMISMKYFLACRVLTDPKWVTHWFHIHQRSIVQESCICLMNARYLVSIAIIWYCSIVYWWYRSNYPTNGMYDALESSSTSWLGQISRLIFKIIAILTTYESDFLRNFTHRSSLMLNEMNMMANWPVCDVNWPSRDVSVLVEALGNAAKWNLKIRPPFSIPPPL